MVHKKMGSLTLSSVATPVPRKNEKVQIPDLGILLSIVLSFLQTRLWKVFNIQWSEEISLCDTFHMIVPRSDGLGQSMCFIKALENARVHQKRLVFLFF